MARIVAAMAMTHSPGLTGWFTRAPEAHQQLALGATAEMRRRLQCAWLRRMQFDDGISVPTHYLNPDARFRLVPVGMNCTVPPLPAPERAYHVGIVLRDVLRAYPGDDRIAVIATGGLSHEPGGPRYFWIDEEFDRWFLDLLAKGDHETLLAECTLERMEAAGSGGTAEPLSWFLVLAMTRGPADVLAYM